MESILARALEYTLKYWLKSFSRDQFKLQGRTAVLYNLDINGEALHASMGLPPALSVTTAKVGKIEIMLPYVSHVQTDPIVVQIDKLDLVLEENPDTDVCRSPSSTPSSTSSARGSGYGYADKIADGMTVQIKTVNLLLETRGDAPRKGEAAWAAPLASITIRNLMLYTTNENWKVVNLKEARDFSTSTGFIYLFKKLEWESLSIDLLPHPDMFTEDNLARSEEGTDLRDDDGAKRVFFGGERFLDGISGQAYITVQRTEFNSPLGLEVQLHITEAVCPALSEPGLRALLRFLTGIYVCLNRGDVDPNSHQQSTEAAGRSLVSIIVDHVFFCIKDPEFQLELLMQSLLFSRTCVSDGEKANYLTKVMIGGLFLRDTFSRPPSTLVQPSMSSVAEEFLVTPEYCKNFCPPIYPLDNQRWHLIKDVPLISLHSLQVKPSPDPPYFATKTVVRCQPLMIDLQEESCLRISSFLADGIVVNPGDVLPDSSVNSLQFILKELDVAVPLNMNKLDNSGSNSTAHKSFAGARLHIENLSFAESPSLKLKLLNLEKDPACFSLWEGQPIDASQKKMMAGASNVNLSLETSIHGELQTSGLWRCVEVKDFSIEVAMLSADGRSLTTVPPPGGIVRIGVACDQYMSNTSVEQLFFVLDLYAYFGKVSEKIAIAGERKRSMTRSDSLAGQLMEKVPSDTAVNLALKDLQLRFLESSLTNIEGMLLVQFIGKDLFMKVTHITLGGAIALSFNLRWESVEVDCVDAGGQLEHENALGEINGSAVSNNGYSQLKPVFWVHNQSIHQKNGSPLMTPFLDISTVHVVPFSELDRECHSLCVTASISGVHLSGGMSYAEALLHRFGILGADGGPGEGLLKGLDNLSAGPWSRLFKSSFIEDLKQDPGPSGGDLKAGGILQLGTPDDIDITVELKDWVFSLEGQEEMAKTWCNNHEDVDREEKCWHTTFRRFQVTAKSTPRHAVNREQNTFAIRKYPVESIIVNVESLQTLKPQVQKSTSSDVVLTPNGVTKNVHPPGGINVGAELVASGEDASTRNWAMENLTVSVKQPIEAIVTKDELEHLTFLCKSEVDSMGRIAAGVLRLLKLEDSIGQSALNQLSNLGTEGFDKIFSARPSRDSSPTALPFSKSVNSRSGLESTVNSLEETVQELEAKCAFLVSSLASSESSAEHVNDIRQLGQKLQSVQSLVVQLRNQI